MNSYIQANVPDIDHDFHNFVTSNYGVQGGQILAQTFNLLESNGRYWPSAKRWQNDALGRLRSGRT